MRNKVSLCVSYVPVVFPPCQSSLAERVFVTSIYIYVIYTYIYLFNGVAPTFLGFLSKLSLGEKLVWS